MVGAFKEIKDRYLSSVSAIGEADKQTLVELVADLLPMSHSKAAQESITADPGIEDPNGLLFNRIGRLTEDILLFLSTFENTSITRLPAGTDIFD
jgi:hypothetical protein